MFTCEFCKDSFTEKRSLTRHQRTVKICIEIQKARQADIISSKYECHYCKKHLCSKDRLHYHMNICRMKPSEAKPNEVKLNEDVNDPTKPIINQSHNTTQNQSHNTNTQSQNSNEHSFNTNYISIVQYMTPDRVEETFAKNYTLSDLMGSQKALAEFTSEHFLNGADKPAYICTDRSRHHFAYMDETKGQIEDVNANMLIRLAMRGFETVTDTYKTKMIELEKKLKIYEREEDAATLVVDIRNQINDLKDNYAKTMNISKEGEGYRSKLSQILPASLVKKTYEEEIFEQLRREDEAHAEKKRLAKLKKDAEAAPPASSASTAAATAAVASLPTNQINEAYNNALKTYRANPDKIFPLVKNADGQRLVCGITAGKLSIFRTFFRNEGIIKLSPLLNGSPEKIEEYIYWIHEEV